MYQATQKIHISLLCEPLEIHTLLSVRRDRPLRVVEAVEDRGVDVAEDQRLILLPPKTGDLPPKKVAEVAAEVAPETPETAGAHHRPLAEEESEGEIVLQLKKACEERRSTSLPEEKSF